MKMLSYAVVMLNIKPAEEIKLYFFFQASAMLVALWGLIHIDIHIQDKQVSMLTYLWLQYYYGNV